MNLVSLEQFILKVSFLFNWHFRFMVRNFRNSLNHRHRYRRGHGFKSLTGLNIFRSYSTISSVVFIATRISYNRFFTAVHIYDFHISTIIIHRFKLVLNVHQYSYFNVF